MMIKCLYCDEMMINNTEYEFVFCGKDHYQVRNSENILLKECWPGTKIPGNVTTIKVFDFSCKVWLLKHNLRDVFHSGFCVEFYKMYSETISRKKYEISESRKMWLLCAKRLKVVPDIRKLIGKMMNLEPFEFWEE